MTTRKKKKATANGPLVVRRYPKRRTWQISLASRDEGALVLTAPPIEIPSLLYVLRMFVLPPALLPVRLVRDA